MCDGGVRLARLKGPVGWLPRKVLRDPSPFDKLRGQDDGKGKGNGNGNCNGNFNGEMRGTLHCATHDETVSGFGRDDAAFLGGGGFKDSAAARATTKTTTTAGPPPAAKDDNQNTTAIADCYEMTTEEAKAKALRRGPVDRSNRRANPKAHAVDIADTTCHALCALHLHICLPSSSRDQRERPPYDPWLALAVFAVRRPLAGRCFL